jgi:hypothetical protein
MSTPTTAPLRCHCPARTHHWVIDLLLAWLHQSSGIIRDELAEFAYGPDPEFDRVDELIELLGCLAAALRPAPPYGQPRQDQ